MCRVLPAFALACHDAGLRTTAESKGGPWHGHTTTFNLRDKRQANCYTLTGIKNREKSMAKAVPEFQFGVPTFHS